MISWPITLSKDSVLQLAKWTRHAYKCEYGSISGDKTRTCTVTPMCWNMYVEHVFRHTCPRVVPINSQKYKCTLPRCTVAGPSTFSASILHQHVESSHMNKIQVPCPFRSCSSNTTYSRALLYDHIQVYHAELMGKVLNQEAADELLRPSSHLTTTRCLPSPKQLPVLPLPANLLMCHVLPSRMGRTRHRSPDRSGPPHSPGGRTRRQMLSPSKSQSQIQSQSQGDTASSQATDDASEAMFADLPQLVPEDLRLLTVCEQDDVQSPLEIAIRPTPVWMARDVSRAQCMFEKVSDKPPPISIHYEAFVKQVLQRKPPKP